MTILFCIYTIMIRTLWYHNGVESGPDIRHNVELIYPANLRRSSSWAHWLRLSYINSKFPYLMNRVLFPGSCCIGWLKTWIHKEFMMKFNVSFRNIYGHISDRQKSDQGSPTDYFRKTQLYIGLVVHSDNERLPNHVHGFYVTLWLVLLTTTIRTWFEPGNFRSRFIQAYACLHRMRKTAIIFIAVPLPPICT